jgi:O-acetyl-ADP-ribose deacetylase (regulator of RNase III)
MSILGRLAMTVVAEHELSSDRVPRVCPGGLTAETVDAIVNDANERATLGGGVAGAIRCRGGKIIQPDCDA